MYPNGWVHKMEKTLNSEYGELHNVYMEELRSKLWIY